MKLKSIVVVLLLLAFSTVCLAGSGSIKEVIAKKRGACPAWGTYGTSDGQILFAWNGAHSGGRYDACINDKTTITGTNSGGAIITDANGLYWQSAGSANDRVVFPINETIIPLERTGGITIWVRMRSSVSGNVRIFLSLFSTVSPDENHTRFVVANGDKPTTYIMGNTTEDIVQELTLITETTFENIGFSWDFDQAGNDHAIVTGTNWADCIEEDDDPVDLAQLLTTLEFGDPQSATYENNAADTLDIQSVVIIVGYKKACPW